MIGICQPSCFVFVALVVAVVVAVLYYSSWRSRTMAIVTAFSVDAEASTEGQPRPSILSIEMSERSIVFCYYLSILSVLMLSVPEEVGSKQGMACLR